MWVAQPSSYQRGEVNFNDSGTSATAAAVVTAADEAVSIASVVEAALDGVVGDADCGTHNGATALPRVALGSQTQLVAPADVASSVVGRVQALNSLLPSGSNRRPMSLRITATSLIGSTCAATDDDDREDDDIPHSSDDVSPASPHYEAAPEETPPAGSLRPSIVAVISDRTGVVNGDAKEGANGGGTITTSATRVSVGRSGIDGAGNGLRLGLLSGIKAGKRLRPITQSTTTATTATSAATAAPTTTAGATATICTDTAVSAASTGDRTSTCTPADKPTATVNLLSQIQLGGLALKKVPQKGPKDTKKDNLGAFGQFLSPTPRSNKKTHIFPASFNLFI